MKRVVLLLLFLTARTFCFVSNAQPEESKPDTVKVGIYITSVHDIDFRQKQYAINLWLWLKYKRPEFDFMKNLEVPMAKSFEKSYATLDTLEDGTIYMLMKLQCVMKGIWKIENFPFDRQKLLFAIEHSVYDRNELVFVPDTFGKHYGKYFLTGWEKDSFNITTDIKEYETSFGDPSLIEPHAEYAAYKVAIIAHRESWEMFIKLFLGMYVSFLIACVCFWIHPDNMDARLTLGVGALFSVIGNKYIIDSALPESYSFTLVDILHGLTLFYIFLVIASSVFTLRLHKKGTTTQAERYNRITGIVLLAAYLVLNVLLIHNAYNYVAG